MIHLLVNEQRTKQAIQSVMSNMMDRVMNKVLFEGPFLKDMQPTQSPLYTMFVPEMIFKGSYFEQHFITAFNQALPELAAVAARERLGRGEAKKVILGVIRQKQLVRINEVLYRLGHQANSPDWDAELAYIREGKGEKIPTKVIVDVYAENPTSGERMAFELKPPLPNSDITKVSKEKLFKLYCMEPAPIDFAYYALPYNPYGKRENYDWSFPNRWFNMREDEVVLVGDEFWERVGGVGTYRAFIEAVNEIGKEYKEQIYREYLGIEPPSDAIEEDTL